MEDELAILKAMDKDTEWLGRNYERIKEEYDNKFIAVKDRGIFASADTLDELIKEIKERNEDPRNALIQFITKITVIL